MGCHGTQIITIQSSCPVPASFVTKIERFMSKLPPGFDFEVVCEAEETPPKRLCSRPPRWRIAVVFVVGTDLFTPGIPRGYSSDMPFPQLTSGTADTGRLCRHASRLPHWQWATTCRLRNIENVFLCIGSSGGC